MQEIKSRNEIVEEVIGWFEQSPEVAQEEFLECSEDDLIMYHSSLGRAIRNEFNLWQVDWAPMVNEDGVDISPAHPDSRSMFIIKDVWRRLHEKRTQK